MTLCFYVNNQVLTLGFNLNTKRIVADSKNYLKAKFIFQTKDWNTELPKYALFSHNGKTYKKYLGIEDGVEENECFVPPEVIKADTFTVSVFCENYITTNIVEIPVEKSGYTDSIENQSDTPQVLEQMNELLYQYASACNEILKECRRIEQRLKGGNK